MSELTVGVISDTHGLLRPQAISALRGCALIIHAGDVGQPEVLVALRGIAPTWAVRGNVDYGDWAAALPATDTVEVGAASFFVLHDIAALRPNTATSGVDAVIFGHSHKPSWERRDGVLFLNPGSAGPRRFKLPVTLARVRLLGRELYPEIVELPI